VVLIVVFGLSGSGKSFLARLLAEHFGFKWIRSDEVRKRLAGLDPQVSAKAPFGEGIYTEEMTRRVYEEMARLAGENLAKGQWVVVDATFLKRWQRELFRKKFGDALFVFAQCPEEEILRRLEGRKDISDADVEIYKKQKEEFEFPEGESYIPLRTDRSPEELLEGLKDLLKDHLR
jgi:gluconokinase